MITIPVTFQSPEEAVQFVNIVSRHEGDVDLKSGHHVVDAKSVVGTLALSTARNVEMLIHSHDCRELVENIGKYVRTGRER